jgi:hypothetical protein
MTYIYRMSEWNLKFPVFAFSNSEENDEGCTPAISTPDVPSLLYLKQAPASQSCGAKSRTAGSDRSQLISQPSAKTEPSDSQYVATQSLVIPDERPVIVYTMGELKDAPPSSRFKSAEASLAGRTASSLDLLSANDTIQSSNGSELSGSQSPCLRRPVQLPLLLLSGALPYEQMMKAQEPIQEILSSMAIEPSISETYFEDDSYLLAEPIQGKNFAMSRSLRAQPSASSPTAPKRSKTLKATSLEANHSEKLPKQHKTKQRNSGNVKMSKSRLPTSAIPTIASIGLSDDFIELSQEPASAQEPPICSRQSTADSRAPGLRETLQGIMPKQVIAKPRPSNKQGRQTTMLTFVAKPKHANAQPSEAKWLRRLPKLGE